MKQTRYPISPMQTAKLSYLQAMGIQPWQLKNKSQSACVVCGFDHDRMQTVLGVGDENAELMIIGEASGFYEDPKGRAGQLLNAMLESIGFDRSSVYIANILQCRPSENQDLPLEEVKLLLEKQIALVQPKLLLAIGTIATHYLLNSQISLEQLREKMYQFNNIPLIITYHPAYLLQHPKDKEKAYRDLQFTYRTLKTF